jgi:hypothetical protein
MSPVVKPHLAFHPSASSYLSLALSFIILGREHFVMNSIFINSCLGVYFGEKQSKAHAVSMYSSAPSQEFELFVWICDAPWDDMSIKNGCRKPLGYRNSCDHILKTWLKLIMLYFLNELTVAVQWKRWWCSPSANLMKDPWKYPKM